MEQDFIKDIFRVEFMGEMRGINAALKLINECVVYSENDKKRYVDGDLFLKKVRERKKILMDRQIWHAEEVDKV